MFRFSKYLGCIGLLSLIGCDGGPTRPTPVDQTFSLSGVVQETFPTSNVSVSGARIEVVDGQHAGKLAVTDDYGRYTISDLAGQVTVRAEKDGYEPDTKSVAVNSATTADFNIHPITPWPVELLNMLSKLSVVEGLRLREFPGSGPSYYSSGLRMVVYVSPAPATGKAGSIAHEICHAHQHRVVLDAGFGEPSDLEAKWAISPEGKDYLDITGWKIGQPEPSCEQWSCGYPRALEDNAELCAQWFDPTRHHASLTGPEWVQRYAPKRYQWAQRWLPMP